MAMRTLAFIVMGLLAPGVCSQVGAQRAAGAPRASSAQDDEEARTLFSLGREAFTEARYERALKYFKQANELSGRPALLFNVGKTLEKLERPSEALQAYRRYLELEPDAPNRPEVEAAVAELEARAGADQAQAAAAPAVPSPEQVAAASFTPAATAGSEGGSGPRDDSGGVATKWWFWTAIGVAVVTGVVVALAAASGGGSGDDSVAAAPTLDSSTRLREL